MDQIGSKEDPFRVGVLAVPGFALMSYACTVEPFRAANLLSGRPLYEVSHFGSTEIAQSSGAASLVCDRRLTDVRMLDLLLVVAGGAPEKFVDVNTFDWLRRCARRGITLGGVSGGPVILAKAGVMDGRRMTVHWEHAPGLSELHPALLIERKLYVIDRDRVTCGGGTAPLDLMHALIADHHGAVFARQISDWFLHTDIRAAAEPQRAGLVERLGVRSPRVLDAVSAMEDHVADPLTLPQLALVSGVTARQMNRLFEAEFQTSTMAYYRKVRLDVALRLIGGTSMLIGDVAQATGFSSAAHFSQVFSRDLGASPQAYRKSLVSRDVSGLGSAAKRGPT